MTDANAELMFRVRELERQLRRVYCGGGALAIAGVALATMAFLRPASTPDVIRTRQLIIEDSAGRARVVLGAPVRDNYRRISPTSGMVIRDSAGGERFGVGLDAKGSVGLGLDAPRCTSDPCNTERINLVADATGGANLRFLDRHTGVAARMILDDDDRVYLDFVKVSRDSLVMRRLGLRADSTFRPKR